VTGLLRDPHATRQAEPQWFPPGPVEYEEARPGDPEWDRREYARKVSACLSLAGFLRYMWPELEPSRPLLWGRHHDVVCWMIEQLLYGYVEGRELIINIPPRHSKSTIVGVAMLAWAWLRAPHLQMMGISADDDVAGRDADKMRALVKTDRYKALVKFAQEFFGPLADQTPWGVSPSQDQKTNFETTRGGRRQGLSVGAKITGKGCDILVVDDPIDAKDVEKSPEGSRKVLEDVNGYYGGAWDSRLNLGGVGVKLVIMQRLGEEDLAGVRLAAGAVSVVLPTEFDPDHPFVCPWDWRKEAGELLFPEGGFDEARIRELKATWDPETYAAQHGQLPVPKSGTRFDESLWQYFDGSVYAMAEDVRRRGGILLATYDCASKDNRRAAYSVIYVLARYRGTKAVHILHEERGKWELDDLQAALDRVERDWRPRVHVIEDASAGTQLISTRRRRVNIFSVTPQMFGGKDSRAGYTVAYLRAGNLLIPKAAAWTRGLVLEHRGFPRGRYKDRVDALAQGLIYLEEQHPVSEAQGKVGFPFLTRLEPAVGETARERAIARSLAALG
jgi:predicted phage terminase large subunit-like protein